MFLRYFNCIWRRKFNWKLGIQFFVCFLISKINFMRWNVGRSVEEANWNDPFRKQSHIFGPQKLAILQVVTNLRTKIWIRFSNKESSNITILLTQSICNCCKRPVFESNNDIWMTKQRTWTCLIWLNHIDCFLRSLAWRFWRICLCCWVKVVLVQNWV